MAPKPLDLTILDDIFGGDSAGISDFLNELVTAVDRVETKIAGAVALDDWSGARHAVHEMKGMCASAGCFEVAELSLAAEAALNAGQHDRMSAYATSLAAACGRLRTAVQAAI